MTLELVANVTKRGVIRFIATSANDPAPAGAQAVLDAVAANDVSKSNFTGSMPVTIAGTPEAARLCIADGNTFTIYAVAQDEEGNFPGRFPNNSTMTR